MKEATMKYIPITRELMKRVDKSFPSIDDACDVLKAINPEFNSEYFMDCQVAFNSIIDGELKLFGFVEDDDGYITECIAITDETDIAGISFILDEQGVLNTLVDFFNMDCDMQHSKDEICDSEDVCECHCHDNDEESSTDAIPFKPFLDDMAISYEEKQFIRILRNDTSDKIIKSLDNADAPVFKGKYIPAVDDIPLSAEEQRVLRAERLSFPL